MLEARHVPFLAGQDERAAPETQCLITLLPLEKLYCFFSASLFHGFRVTQRDVMNAVGADTVALEHLKSGATVYFIAADDPNCAFDLSFRTPAPDERGIPHVFEHVTISGSEKYPSPNLTLPVFNQTYNTYGNAYTHDRMTTYPLGPLSEDQLLKLMDYYMDGLFHPLLLTEERLFRREAWRYELTSPDAPLMPTGTVYSDGNISPNSTAGPSTWRTAPPRR